MTWTCRCGKEIRGMRAEHCAECHETFTSTEAGDLHRTGPHDGHRRCLTPVEMETRTRSPLERDERGYWRRCRLGLPPAPWARSPIENSEVGDSAG